MALGGGGGFVEQRGAGQVESGEVDGQLLEIQQRFQAALGDFRLVGRIGSVPAGILQHVAEDHRRRHGAVVAHADQAGPALVEPGVAAQARQGGLFVERGGQFQRPVEADRRRHRLHDQFGASGNSEEVQHGLLFRRIGAEVAAQEGIGGLELGEGRRLRHGFRSRWGRHRPASDRRRTDIE